MNDELVYALLALSLHWWLGWKVARTIAKGSGFVDLGEELMMVTMIFFFGSFMFITAYGGWILRDYYRDHGSLFNDNKEKDQHD